MPSVTIFHGPFDAHPTTSASWTGARQAANRWPGHQAIGVELSRDLDVQAVLRSYGDLLTRPLVAHLATVRPDGSPQVSPVWVRWDGTYLWLTMTTTRQRYRNITSHPSVAMSIIDPDDPYRYLEVRGRTERIDADPEAAEFLHLASRYGLTIDAAPRDAPQRLAVAVRPTAASHQAGLPGSFRSRPPKTRNRHGEHDHDMH